MRDLRRRFFIFATGRHRKPKFFDCGGREDGGEDWPRINTNFQDNK
jgi:hypothetical protein